VNYRILAVLQQRVCRHFRRDVDELSEIKISLRLTDGHWSSDWPVAI